MESLEIIIPLIEHLLNKLSPTSNTSQTFDSFLTLRSLNKFLLNICDHEFRRKFNHRYLREQFLIQRGQCVDHTLPWKRMRDESFSFHRYSSVLFSVFVCDEKKLSIHLKLHSTISKLSSAIIVIPPDTSLQLLNASSHWLIPSFLTQGNSDVEIIKMHFRGSIGTYCHLLNITNPIHPYFEKYNKTRLLLTKSIYSHLLHFERNFDFLNQNYLNAVFDFNEYYSKRFNFDHKNQKAIFWLENHEQTPPYKFLTLYRSQWSKIIQFRFADFPTYPTQYNIVLINQYHKSAILIHGTQFMAWFNLVGFDKYHLGILNLDTMEWEFHPNMSALRYQVSFSTITHIKLSWYLLLDQILYNITTKQQIHIGQKIKQPLCLDNRFIVSKCDSRLKTFIDVNALIIN